jgi:hypothetical protein
MNHRIAAIVIAGALFAGTHAYAAAAAPLPDPPSRHSVVAVRATALAELTAAYRTATLSDQRRIHNEITMILHRPRQAWAL